MGCSTPLGAPEQREAVAIRPHVLGSPESQLQIRPQHVYSCFAHENTPQTHNLECAYNQLFKNRSSAGYYNVNRFLNERIKGT
jgi:hypothetical protein